MTARGFTLLELLAGLVVLGFIMAGLSQGVRYGLRAGDSQARLIEGRGELDAVDRALRRLIVAADPGGSRTGGTLAGDAATLRFVSVLPAAATGFAGQEAEIGIGLAPGGRLVLRWTPRVHARRIAAPPPPQETALLEGVTRLELAYWRDGWRPVWEEQTLPALIRLRLGFAPGDPRHWPDIVLAPARGRVR